MAWRYGQADLALPKNIEEFADQELSQQPFGGIRTVKGCPVLRALLIGMLYEGERWIAKRRQVDQLDQVTFTRRR